MPMVVATPTPKKKCRLTRKRAFDEDTMDATLAKELGNDGASSREQCNIAKGEGDEGPDVSSKKETKVAKVEVEQKQSKLAKVEVEKGHDVSSKKESKLAKVEVAKGPVSKKESKLAKVEVENNEKGHDVSSEKESNMAKVEVEKEEETSDKDEASDKACTMVLI